MLKPTPTSASYPRLVLPPEHHSHIIRRAHEEVGHMATHKTLDRVREAYVWPGMRKRIKEELARCGICRTHTNRAERPPMGEIPIANYPTQIIGLDLIGPFAQSVNGNKYLSLLIIVPDGRRHYRFLISQIKPYGTHLQISLSHDLVVQKLS